MARKTIPLDHGQLEEGDVVTRVKFPQRLLGAKPHSRALQSFVGAAAQMTMMEQRRRDGLLQLIEAYDPRDEANFAYLTALVLGYTQKSDQIAKLLGVSGSTLHRWANDVCTPPTVSRVGAKLIYKTVLTDMINDENITVASLKEEFERRCKELNELDAAGAPVLPLDTTGLPDRALVGAR